MSEVYVRLGEDNVVKFIHKYPFDPTKGLHRTREELEQNGVFVDNVPEPEMKQGMRSVPKYNSDTKSIYYEYTPIPLTNEERLSLIEDAINEIIMAE